MSIDSTLVVSLVTVGGTLGAAALTQFAGIRNKRLDAEIQQRRTLGERAEEASADKLAIYVALNAAARDYRAFGHDYLMRKMSDVEPAKIEQLNEVSRGI